MMLGGRFDVTRVDRSAAEGHLDRRRARSLTTMVGYYEKYQPRATASAQRSRARKATVSKIDRIDLIWSRRRHDLSGHGGGTHHSVEPRAKFRRRMKESGPIVIRRGK
ncbi:hypothetical protein [Rhodovulum sp. PH10]|uniref:hypothetical protein n=1 Tax=Rhodovulum sp. PH10 TaxID=1187851 RepID=UPI0012F9DB8A|nr:hypothetical protein [Rhodovulum sp. PH10]